MQEKARQIYTELRDNVVNNTFKVSFFLFLPFREEEEKRDASVLALARIPHVLDFAR